MGRFDDQVRGSLSKPMLKGIPKKAKEEFFIGDLNSFSDWLKISGTNQSSISKIDLKTFLS